MTIALVSFLKPQTYLPTECTTPLVCAPIYENVYVCETKISTLGVGKSLFLLLVSCFATLMGVIYRGHYQHKLANICRQHFRMTFSNKTYS